MRVAASIFAGWAGAAMGTTRTLGGGFATATVSAALEGVPWVVRSALDVTPFDVRLFSLTPAGGTFDVAASAFDFVKSRFAAARNAASLSLNLVPAIGATSK